MRAISYVIKKEQRKLCSLRFYLSVKDKLCEFNGFNDLAVLVNSHVTGSDLVDEYNFIAVVTEFKFDIPKVKTDGFKVVCDDLCDSKCLSFEAFEHFSCHNLERNKTFACYERVALCIVFERAFNVSAFKGCAVFDIFAISAYEAACCNKAADNFKTMAKTVAGRTSIVALSISALT